MTTKPIPPATTHLRVVPQNFRAFKNGAEWATVFSKEDPQAISRRYPKSADLRSLFATKGPGPNLPITLCHQPASSLVVGDAVKHLEQLIKTENIESIANLENVSTGTWEWIVDNGYMDSLATGPSSDQSNSNIAEYLRKVQKVLAPSGSHIIISLGFDLVLANLIRHHRDLNVQFEVVPIRMPKERGMSHPVFIFVVTGNDGEAKQPLLYNLFWCPKTSPIVPIDLMSLFRVVKDIRLQLYHQIHLGDYKEGQLHFFEVLDESRSDRKVVYQMTLYDRITDSKKTKNVKPTVAILVPLADQHHWLYKTAHGHQRLAERAGCLRIMCVFLPDFGELSGDQIHPVQTVEKIKQDLGPRLVEMSVDTSQPVLLMTQQERFEDERVVVRRAESEYAGKIMVFDAVVDKDDEELHGARDETQVTATSEASGFVRRTMIFECNPRAAQTEIWYRKDDNKQLEMIYEHVCHSYHLMVVASLLTLIDWDQGKCKGAIIGVGGGVLSSLLRMVFGNAITIESIDIDPTVVDIAKSDFLFKEDEGNSIVTADGIQYIKEHRGADFDFIIVDVNGAPDKTTNQSHGLTAPPEIFYQEPFLNDAKGALKAEGILLFNVVCQTDGARFHLGKYLRAVFPSACSLKLMKDYNEIALATEKPAISISAIDNKVEDLRALFQSKASQFPNLSQVIDHTPLYLSKGSACVGACLPM